MTAILNDNEFDPKFEKLFREEWQMLHRVAYRIIGDFHQAEEAVQDGYMKLLKRPWPKGLIDNPVGFLHRIVENRALDLVRARNRRPVIRIGDMEIPAGGDYPEFDDDRLEQMRLALAEMKPRLVTILNLCLKEGQSVPKVAKRLRMRMGTVYSDLFRAKFQVRKLIRLQEKKDEAQKAKRPGIPKPGVADPPTR